MRQRQHRQRAGDKDGEQGVDLSDSIGASGQRTAAKMPDTWLQALPHFQISFFLATPGASIHDSAVMPL